MISSQEEKKVDMFNFEEVRKCCDFLNCTPYELFIAYKAVGNSVNDIKKYIESKVPEKSNVSRVGIFAGEG